MKAARFRYIFYISSALIFFLMLFSIRDAGITCDEVLHYNHSVAVYNFFSTHGTDRSALDTPVTHLKYYGQSYDNVVTFLISWFNIEDIYAFRHFMSIVAGWLVIFITALFAIWLADYRAGIIIIILFAVSPTFFGHTLNNLKDIPFALGYISFTYFTFKFLVSRRKIPWSIIMLMIASMSFSISIRAGGLILIFYLFFFFFVFYFFSYLTDKKVDKAEILVKLIWIPVISILSLMLSILLWPFALQSPFENILRSYSVMAHFPDTFRQIFEGRVLWSDYMPWYYLPKSMAITIPFLVMTGFLLFIFFIKRIFIGERLILYLFIIFTILFPVSFVMIEKSNLYSSWRQFLFIYPGMLLIASIGFLYLFEFSKKRYVNWAVVAFIAFLSVHPLRFMIMNHPYHYLYYNQFVGGLKGAYANYEMDYYYVSQTEASKWLLNYIRENDSRKKIKIRETFAFNWPYLNHPEIESSYFRGEERSMYDWDYAIVVNRYITPFNLLNNFWPPENSIHTIYVDDVPVCAVLERNSKDDYYGYIALKEGRNKDAIKFFENVLKVNDKDEMIFYNFAAALYNDGQYQKADSVLKKGLEINPDFEPILMYLGNIARVRNNPDEAIRYYERLIAINRKYFEAYVGLSELLAEKDVIKARALLRTCLRINPQFKPAVIALADTYRKSNPDIAKKYDEIANEIK